MRKSASFEFPPEQVETLRKARRLEWWTLAYLVSAVVLMYFVLGSSQAMRTAWIEDMLSLIPPIVFLIASRIALWPPNDRFPYGYHRATSIAFLCAALALLSVGAWLLIESVMKLVKMEHPTIGGIHLFGQTIWLGWLMLPVLLWSAVPAVFLGRAKLPLADELHDKTLEADAKMNKADWLTALAAMVGIIGVGFGYWWTDAVAAAVISLDIIHDGYTNLRQVVRDLMDEVPQTVDSQQRDPLPDRVVEYLEKQPWVQEVQVRMREEGHVYFGEVFLVASDETNLPEKLARAAEECSNLNWRIHDLVLMPVPSLEERHGENPAQEELSSPSRQAK